MFKTDRIERMTADQEARLYSFYETLLSDSYATAAIDEPPGTIALDAWIVKSVSEAPLALCSIVTAALSASPVNTVFVAP